MLATLLTASDTLTAGKCELSYYVGEPCQKPVQTLRIGEYSLALSMSGLMAFQNDISVGKISFLKHCATGT